MWHPQLLGCAFTLSLAQLKIAANAWFFVSLILYGLLAIIAVFSLLSQTINLRNPITIREYYWDKQPEDFKMDILTHMEDSFTQNKRPKLILKLTFL